jgi:ribonuclease P protein component
MSDEADLSAEQPGACAPARLPRPDGNSRRPQRDPCASRPGPQQAVGVKAVGLTGLTQRKDYLAANAGRRAPMPGFVLLVRMREDGDSAMRLGITVTKKIGNAVVRNRMKRRFRALAREILPTLGLPGADHVLIGRQGGVERPFDELKSELAKACAKVRR